MFRATAVISLMATACVTMVTATNTMAFIAAQRQGVTRKFFSPHPVTAASTVGHHHEPRLGTIITSRNIGFGPSSGFSSSLDSCFSSFSSTALQSSASSPTTTTTTTTTSSSPPTSAAEEERTAGKSRLFPEQLNLIYDSRCSVCRMEIEFLQKRMSQRASKRRKKGPSTSSRQRGNEDGR